MQYNWKNRRCISNKEHYELTMGSLFDGIGGFPLAAVRHGIRPVWASEIEAFSIEVTKLRFTDMIHVRIFQWPEQEPDLQVAAPDYLWNKSEA